ncbi:MAG TPA: hypothetical protein VN193_00010 [Candidatus Angelobacter sp.]|nr:hypothetical protein [Candidatus Angelobacter sp.]
MPIESAAPEGQVVESPAPPGSPAAEPAGDAQVPDAEAEAPAQPSAPEAVAEPSEAADAPADESPDASDAAALSASASPKKRAARRAPGTPGSAQERRTTAQRLGNFPRADRPANIPSPEHHHLPGWVRRDFARARPPLSNILALLEGEVRDSFSQRINELTAGISAGRFSLAWQYPDLVDEGRTLYEQQRRETAESARANRQLDTARRRVQDRIRDAGDNLTADVAARLQRQLRTAGDAEAINAIASELDGVATAAKTTAEKRREREIERTRARIMRSAAAAGAVEAPPQQETWQDVLRRFAEQQAAGSRNGE